MSVGPVRDMDDERQNMTLSPLSRLSEDLSSPSDVPPPLPTSPVPSEPFISYSTDLDDVQVTDLPGVIVLYLPSDVQVTNLPVLRRVFIIMITVDSCCTYVQMSAGALHQSE